MRGRSGCRQWAGECLLRPCQTDRRDGLPSVAYFNVSPSARERCAGSGAREPRSSWSRQCGLAARGGNALGRPACLRHASPQNAATPARQPSRQTRRPFARPRSARTGVPCRRQRPARSGHRRAREVRQLGAAKGCGIASAFVRYRKNTRTCAGLVRDGFRGECNRTKSTSASTTSFKKICAPESQ